MNGTKVTYDPGERFWVVTKIQGAWNAFIANLPGNAVQASPGDAIYELDGDSFVFRRYATKHEYLGGSADEEIDLG